MFDQKELSEVLKTLTQRHSWLAKAIDKPDVTDKARQEHESTLKTLDSAIKKLAKLKPSVQQDSAQTSAPKPASSLNNRSASTGIKPVRKPATRYEALDPNDACVLIAEDNPDSAELLVCLLEDVGIPKDNIDIAKDGKLALQMLTKGDTVYDIVLCDWDMPFLTGYEVCKQTRPLAKFQNTHFMMVTAVSEVSRIKDVIAIGINDYIVKPVDADILEKKVKAALAGYVPPETSNGAR